MAEIEIKTKGFRCERCNHEWIPRLKEYPTICPVCKSAYWDKPRKNKKRDGKKYNT
jgi:Zn finger protein HypA/HybF involved in hydrogenase expression